MGNANTNGKVYYKYRVDDGINHYVYVKDGSLSDPTQQYPNDAFYKDLNDLSDFILNDNINNFIFSGIDSKGDSTKHNQLGELQKNWRKQFLEPILQLKSLAKKTCYPNTPYFLEKYKLIMSKSYDTSYFVNARAAFADEFVSSIEHCRQLNAKELSLVNKQNFIK